MRARKRAKKAWTGSDAQRGAVFRSAFRTATDASPIFRRIEGPRNRTGGLRLPVAVGYMLGDGACGGPAAHLCCSNQRYMAAPNGPAWLAVAYRFDDLLQGRGRASVSVIARIV